MTHDEECYQQYLANELKDNDTFQFECYMCGGCCRRRAEPVVINGPDLFRIAQALRLPPAEAAKECTAYEFGLRKSEDDVRVWTRLVLELAKVTRGMDEKEISGLLLDILLGTCYLQYDISKPYIPQVEAHIELLKDILPHMVRIPKGMRLFED